ncbi:MAG TPA: DUF1570 domain-containing protein [Pirellulales bacterium]|jgi:hypothetical protein
MSSPPQRNRILACWLTAIVLASVAIAGCASVFKGAAALPTRHAVVLDQLVIHSDFHLPRQHRMLEDLRALRTSMQSKLDLKSSDEPIHVYLFENERKFEAFCTAHFPQFPSRRAFFVQNDTSLAVYAQWGDRVSEDLRHEVAHGYLHSVLPEIPLWLDEGLAEYFETPRNASGLNRPHVEWLTAERAKGVWQPNLARLEQLNSAASMTQTDYAESWAWIHMLLETIPPRRELLQAHLKALHGSKTHEPLSVSILHSTSEPNRSLLDHLAQLAAKK